MKLWLDDIRDPKNPRIQAEYGAEGDEIWVKTVYEAIRYLKQPGIESISLDFDLEPGCGNGLEVAQWIEEQAIKGELNRLLWSVHSSNREARWKMAACLKRADEAWSKYAQ